MENKIIMLNSVTNVQMNSFIITTADGRIIVMDGGFDQDAENLLSWLKKLTGQEIPHVDAWFFSHPHLDHISAFIRIMETCPEAVEIDKIYYNFPSLQFLACEEPNEITPVRFYRIMPTFADKVVIISAGDEYDVGEAHFEVLCSPSPEFNHNVFNNASCILMMTLGGKKTLFLGDAGVEEGEKTLRMYKDHPEKLKADYVQMAHHGQNGVERNFYEAVAPTGCLWCTPKWLWDNDAGKGFNTHIFKTVTVRGWMQELGVREHYIMMNGVQIIDL